MIEDGLKYIDHQRNTDRGPLDVLFVDSGNALVVAELKINEDDAKQRELYLKSGMG
ncbi:hypothetical protein LCGC14_1794790, partial [marine sediment metagenome]